jgi:hypothetical protein
MPQPGDADPVAGQEAVGTFAGLDDLAHDLVARDHSAAPRRKLTQCEVQIRAADPTGTDPDENLSAVRGRHRTLNQDQWRLADRPGLGDHPRAHHWYHRTSTSALFR